MDTVISRLRAEIKRHGSQRAAAKHLGISASYLCDLLAGNRSPGDSVLKRLGLKKQVTYVVRTAHPVR